MGVISVIPKGDILNSNFMSFSSNFITYTIVSIL